MTTRRHFVLGLAGLGMATALPARAETSGRFRGASRHVTTGTVTVTPASGGAVIRLGADFSLDGAPDPVVGLGHNGSYDARTFAGELRSNSGAQSYTLPRNVRAEAYNEVYIWCRRFGVPLGVARVS